MPLGGGAGRLIYWLGHYLARFCFSVFGRLEVAGRELLPPHGPVILVCNHLSYNDPPMLVAAMRRPLYFMGKRELFASLISRFIMRSFHVFPVERQRAGSEAIKTMLELLAGGRTLVIFPEGTRSGDGRLQEGMLGVVYLALKAQAPILPVGISGTQKFPFWRLPFPLCRVRISVGPPFSLPVVEGTAPRAAMRSMLEVIMQRIAAQLPPEQRGQYALPPTPPDDGRPTDGG